MANITHKKRYHLNQMDKSPLSEPKLGDIIYNLQNATTLTELAAIHGDVLIGGSDGVTSAIQAGVVLNAMIGANAVSAAKVKVVARTLTVAIGATSATVTNAADENGIVLGAYFNSATADATATAITSKRFVPATGALTVTVNAAATAATTIVVSILQV